MSTSNQALSSLAKERQLGTFNPQAMARFLLGDEHLRRQDKVMSILQSDTIFDQSDRFFLSRLEAMKKAFLMNARWLILAKYYELTYEEFTLGITFIGYPSILHLHESMFIPGLRTQGTDEQHEKFLKPALRHEIIGCYSQTELGHGSNVQGLETTAEFIPDTDEFEIHSPTPTSTKWWSGGLGVVATHSMVMARLIVKGRDYGPHPFVVPIRSLETHQPFPGIKVGDIGPKLGFNTVDNGYIAFDHYRIPHDHMLERFAKVTRDGRYIRPSNAKLTYGTMVYVRQLIVRNCAFGLAKAATVATRYCATRQQFAADKNESQKSDQREETAVLNYTMVQYRILPVLAQAFAFQFTGIAMSVQYEDFLERVSHGDLSTLADLHATSSGLKAFSSDLLIEGIETCRRAMGGHGYSSFSGLGDFYLDSLPNVTWEGDNYILSQQVARYLLKTARSLAGNSTLPSAGVATTITAQYLGEYLRMVRANVNKQPLLPLGSPSELEDLNKLVSVFGRRSAYLVWRLLDRMDNHHQTWNDSLVAMCAISRAHSQYIVLFNFVKACQQLQSTSTTPQQHAMSTVLESLCCLFAVHTMERYLADFLEAGLVTAEQAPWIRQATLIQLTTVRQDAITLCDAWALPDYCLHSLLGRSDGQPYASLTAAAESEPINHLSPALGGYESVLKPLMNYERWRETGQYSKLNQYRVTSNPVIQGLSKL